MNHLRRSWAALQKKADRRPPSDVMLHMVEFDPMVWAKFEAFDRSGRRVGELRIDFTGFYEDERRSRFSPYGRMDPAYGKVAWVSVVPDRRREGIANALFDFAVGNLAGIEVGHDDPYTQTPEGKAWAFQA